MHTPPPLSAPRLPYSLHHHHLLAARSTRCATTSSLVDEQSSSESVVAVAAAAISPPHCSIITTPPSSDPCSLALHRALIRIGGGICAVRCNNNIFFHTFWCVMVCMPYAYILCASSSRHPFNAWRLDPCMHTNTRSHACIMWLLC